MLTKLPIELIIHILLELEWYQIIACRRVCKDLDRIIQTRATLQYQIELGIAGYESTLQASATQPSILSRLNRLRQLQETWLNLSFKLSEKIPLSAGMPTYEYSQGVFMRGMSDALDADDPLTTGLKGYIMPSTFPSAKPSQTWEVPKLEKGVRDFTLDPVQGLAVLVEETKPQEVGKMCTVIVHLRSLFKNEPHPDASLPSFTLKMLRLPSQGYCLTIVDDILFLLCCRRELRIWNWKTGILHSKIDKANNLLIHHIIDMVVLSPTSFLLTKAAEQGSVEILVYDIQFDDPAQEPKLRTIFRGPDLLPNSQLALRCRSDPPPSRCINSRRSSNVVSSPSSSSSSTSSPNDETPITPSCFNRPFHVKEKSRILAFGGEVARLTLDDFQLESGFIARDFTIFVRPSTFLQEPPSWTAIDIERRVPVVQAADWMIETRLIRDLPLEREWVCFMYGERMAYMEDKRMENLFVNEIDQPTTAHLHVYDFNPEIAARFADRPKRLWGGESFVFEKQTETAKIKAVFGEEEFGRDLLFEKPIKTGLPYVVSEAINGVDLAAEELMEVVIDDERVIFARLAWESDNPFPEPKALEVYC